MKTVDPIKDKLQTVEVAKADLPEGIPNFLMIDEQQQAALLKKAEKRAEQLIKDFTEHKNLMTTLYPELEGSEAISRTFEGWSIQMIANLQVAIENMH